jgi:dTDP-L-rhamnose 4-epimerase
MSELVLVTGGAGYIGSIVVDELLACGFRVRVLDGLIHGSVPSLLLPWGKPSFEFVRSDVRDPAARTTAVEDVDAVVHLAISMQPKLFSATPSAPASSASSSHRPAATTEG